MSKADEVLGSDTGLAERIGQKSLASVSSPIFA
jgi:hypothetical protein